MKLKIVAVYRCSYNMYSIIRRNKSDNYTGIISVLTKQKKLDYYINIRQEYTKQNTNI